jgi:cystathionine gamma-lyase
MLWMESPTNPLMKVADLRELAVITKAHDALSVCDNTFASPALQNPLKLGVDLVVHSMTKYLGGHADVLGGALVMNREDLFDRLRFAQNALGAVPSPFDAWLILRGIKTLSVRMEKHCDNAERLAAFLKAHSAVAKVHYPGLPDDPGHAVAKKQMRRFGGMLSFEVQDPKGLMDRLKRLEVITLAESLGGVESLIEVPATMTHKSVPVEQQKKQGITEGLVRFSVGIEDAEDLIDDIRRALS